MSASFNSLTFNFRSAASAYQRGVSGASACCFLVWEDALAYYADSYHAGHVHISNASAERSLRGTSRVQLQPGNEDLPIFIPSATSTPAKPVRKEKNVSKKPAPPAADPMDPATPTRPSGYLGTDSNPIYISSAAPTPQPLVVGGPVRVPAVRGPNPHPSTPSGRRLLEITAALSEVQASSATPTMPPASQPRKKPSAATFVSKTKPRFIVTNDSDDDDDTITGYFGVKNFQKSYAAGSSGAGPSRLA